MKVTIMISHTVAALYVTHVGSVSARRIGLLRNDLSSSIRMAYEKQKSNVLTKSKHQNTFDVNHDKDLLSKGYYDSVWDTSVSMSMSLSMSMSMPTDLISDFPSLTPSFAPSMDTNAGQLPSDIPSYVRGTSTSISPSGSQGKEGIEETVVPTQSPTSQLIPRVEGESPKQKDATKPRGISNIVPTIVVLNAASAILIGLIAARRRIRANRMISCNDGMSSNESLSSSINDIIVASSV